MANFHVNPETGEPGKCSAAPGNCPYNAVSDHFESAEAAREGYEKEMEARERYFEVKAIAEELVEKTLALRAIMDERKMHKASDPEWAEIKERVAAAKAEQKAVLDRARRRGRIKYIIGGINDDGTLYNASQPERVRTYHDGYYAQISGVPVRAGSDIPMPGDLKIDENREKWQELKDKMDALPKGSAEREDAKKDLIVRIVNDTPVSTSAKQFSSYGWRDLKGRRLKDSKAPHELQEMRRRAGVNTDYQSKENVAFVARATKAAKDFAATIED